MKSTAIWHWSTITSILLSYVHKGSCIGCFSCYSLDGSIPDCDDEFATYDKTRHLFKSDCRVGLLEFESFYCVKIKGVKKKTGESVLIRTCSVDDWGNVCGEIRFEQGGGEEPPEEDISGCLSSCDHDGCNASQSLHRRRRLVVWIAALVVAAALQVALR